MVPLLRTYLWPGAAKRLVRCLCVAQPLHKGLTRLWGGCGQGTQQHCARLHEALVNQGTGLQVGARHISETAMGASRPRELWTPWLVGVSTEGNARSSPSPIEMGQLVGELVRVRRVAGCKQTYSTELQMQHGRAVQHGSMLN